MRPEILEEGPAALVAGCAHRRRGGEEGALAILGRDDVVFPVLHGTYGEDGTVQGLLELADVAYVGSGHLGSGIGMDKHVAKRLLIEAGIPVVPFRLITAAELRRDPEAAARRAGRAGLPPVRQAGQRRLVGRREQGEGRRPPCCPRCAWPWTTTSRRWPRRRSTRARSSAPCWATTTRRPRCPARSSCTHRDGFYSYEAKYVDENGAETRIPADIPPETAQRVRELSVATFRALELAGMARVDFFLDRKTGALAVNEVNTIPGFTAISMYPKLWEASGIPPKDLVSRLIDLALERRAARRALKTSY